MLYLSQRGILVPMKETMAFIVKTVRSLASKTISNVESGADGNNLSEFNVRFR